jgi:hypothetical protein
MTNATEAAPLRKVPTNLLCDLGWLSGTFHVPQYQSLMDYFTGGVHLLKCTRVRLPGEQDLVPFIAFRRENVLLVEPTLGDELIETAGSAGRTTPRQVGCLLPSGILRGTLEVLVNVRVSDYLRQQPAFLLLRDCVVSPYGQRPDPTPSRRLKLAIVNWSRAIGVSEWSR